MLAMAAAYLNSSFNKRWLSRNTISQLLARNNMNSDIDKNGSKQRHSQANQDMFYPKHLLSKFINIHLSTSSPGVRVSICMSTDTNL